ncbi:MAG TPA: hypothetical protein VL974_05190 [Magnetospirillum sp.]|nr:hypothetical protein [Magnetospirillum sp.]
MLALVPAAARAQSCADGRSQVAFRLVAELPQPAYRHRLTRSQLGALKGHGHMTSDRSHAGLTETQTSFSVKPVLEFFRQSNGRVCAVVKQVQAEWRMTNFMVDIAAEYQPGSCPYGEIVSHENQHVAIHQRAFTQTEQALRARLGELARNTRPFLLQGTPQQAATEVANRFMAAAKPYVEKYQADTQRENGVIDTPQNYRAVTARCRDW